MGTVTEIESAIERLGPAEFAELARWISHRARSRSLSLEGRKRDPIRRTAGCLTEEDGADLARAVAEAGRDVADTHEW